MKKAGRIAKSIAVAFSIYSVIPMPHFEWKSEDMEYHLIFFPWVGGVIGLLELFWRWAETALGAGDASYGAIATVIPLLVTGGFHMDGYLDTMDAIHSYKPREEKLKIMSDPHIGAFAVVWAGIWFLLFYAGASELIPGRIFYAYCWSFFLSRALSGLGVVTLPSAKKSGMLQTFAGTAQRNTVMRALVAELCICSCIMGAAGGIPGLLMVAGSVCCFYWYRHWAVSKFGGITGDLAGFFLCVTELVMTLMAGLLTVLL